MLTMYQQITIKTLKKQGKLNKEIARDLNCHRNTVRNVLCREFPIEKQTRRKQSYFATFKDRIEELLKKGITRIRIWEMLRDEYGVIKPYITLCKYVETAIEKKPEAFVVQNTASGEEAEVDFGYLGLIRDLSGVLRKAYGFVMVLCYSRHAYFGVVYNQSVQSFISACIAACEYFGGVPKRIKIDNLKAAVLKNRRYDLEFNQSFLEFAYHYGFVITPCTPYEPQQKGKVEKGVCYLKNNFMKGRTFTDRTDLERQLKGWMNSYANLRTHGTTRKIPYQVFITEEKDKLQKLPETPFSFYQSCQRLVKQNCHINLGTNYYSVSSQYVGKTVEVRWQDNLIKIIYRHEEIARHILGKGKGEYITTPAHFPDFKVYSETGYQAQYEEKMREIGPWAHSFFQQAVKENSSYWNRTVRKILGLVPLYGREKVEKAIKRALFYKAYQASIIKNILENHLEDAEIEQPLLSGTVLNQPETAETIAGQKTDMVTRELSYYQSIAKEGDDAQIPGSVMP